MEPIIAPVLLSRNSKEVKHNDRLRNFCIRTDKDTGAKL